MKRGCNRQLKWVVFFMVLALVGNSFSAKYREFKNKEGKTIRARIIQYDAEADKVELELPNRKKAWIELASLSAEDQGYIEQWEQNEAAKVSKGKSLSEKEVRAIAEQYIKALMDRDYHLWAKLVVAPRQGRLPRESQWKEHSEEGIYIEIKEIDGLNVLLNIKTKEGKYREGWLQLLPDGRIKYAPLSFPHPLGISFRYGFILYLDRDETSNVEAKQRALNYLQSNKIPLFGYEHDASAHMRKRSAKKILDWMIKEGATWDAYDPKIPLPEKQFKELSKEYKEYKGRFG